MLEWLLTSISLLIIGESIKATDKAKYKQYQQNRHSYTPPKPPTRYQNRGKQMMYEVYLKDLKENPEWAAFKVKHGNYGGYVFDDTEN